MELQQFITTAIKAIGRGIQEGNEGNIKSDDPLIGKDYNRGVEFDLGIRFDDNKITVVGSWPKDSPVVSRIKFSLPLTTK